MLNLFVKQMKVAGLADDVIRTFSAYYDQLQSGEQGMISRGMIDPPPRTTL